MAHKKFEIPPLCDNHAVTMFYACALDLLVQTEIQHRQVIEAHTQLETCIAQWRLNPPTPAGRHTALSMLANVVGDVVKAVRAQRALAIDMQKALAALQANGDKP